MNDTFTYNPSLINELPPNEKKVDLLNEAAWELRRIDTKNAFQLSQTAQLIANDISYQKGLQKV